ncbi:pyridoxamine 5'-phosphate oxidase family protein [Halalkalibacter krulwichiae]|uniref:Pyridoxamine 5'-phosphate oxidase n=1 Tax=Halalkalibacter krulwichiae TaxID=199441 RepID=A0A1X9MDH4_9BACI|nr:pyridoxamine 5'-phosphate oxidase family protein [Halalkalibacter krulwichiae]ARK30600.1 Pyridoxamine 5'-phosphate oxidase [Halalkalibacter krulwichiae]
MPKMTGEQVLQEKYQTTKRAKAFYDNQMLDHVNVFMQEFIKNQEMVFISTSDQKGNCDSSFRSGPRGFVKILNQSTLMYPEYRGNGVMASMGNMIENPNIGLMFIDFIEHRIGLHVNGKAYIYENEELDALNLSEEQRMDIRIEEGKKATRWVIIEIKEAFIHCSKNIPKLKKDKEGEVQLSGGDFFNVKQTKRKEEIQL